MSIPIQLDISKYLLAVDDDIQVAYNLEAVILHSGSTTTGHYIVCIRHRYDNNWYLYDDDKVSIINIEVILSAPDQWIPSMVIYTKEDVNVDDGISNTINIDTPTPVINISCTNNNTKQNVINLSNDNDDDNKHVISDYIYKIHLTESDLKLLRDDQALNDNIVQVILRKVLDTFSEEVTSEVCVLDLRFYEYFVSSGYKHVTCWTHRTNIFLKQYLFIPILMKYHYTLVCVIRPGNIDSSKADSNLPCILFLDSSNAFEQEDIDNIYKNVKR